MKAFFPILLIAAAVPGAPALAQPSAEATSAPSPLLGSWAVDVLRMSAPPEARPRSVTITYSDVGEGKWRTNVDIVGGDGSKLNAVGTYKLDGTPAPSKGYPGADTAVATMPARNVMVMALYKDGMPRTTRTYVVAPDGGSMTETVVYLNLNGTPEMLTNHFNRVR